MAAKYATSWGTPIPTPKSRGLHALVGTITNTTSGDEWYLGYLPRNARVVAVITRVTTGLASSTYSLVADSTTLASGISTASAGTSITGLDGESNLPAPSGDYQSDPGALIKVVPGGAYGTVSYQVTVLYYLV